ncbi:hypothetical protein [Polycladidibacter hongkongensis]|uniref:hypothetical protein n=1 Tax=Polycladidibacter hongkongensis TaxID=1647556 RepID=UPI000834C3FB|nr:hypothetical protein [Pseudovibrio hongkongensis]
MTSQVSACIFAALGCVHRLLILRLLFRAGNTGLTWGELKERTGCDETDLQDRVSVLLSVGLIARSMCKENERIHLRRNRFASLKSYFFETS